MASESDSTYCSTCNESHYESSLSDTSLDDEDIDYTNLLKQSNERELFYLQLIENKTSDDWQSRKAEDPTPKNLDPMLTKNDRLRSSYNKLTSWIFNNKIKNKSFKRKSTKKMRNGTQSEAYSGDNRPTIEISDCDQNNTNLVNNSNKLFDLINGKYEAHVSKVDNKFILMYLMPPNESQTDCLIYSYPKTESDDSNNPILLKLKGMLITLSQVVSQITNQSIDFSSVAVNHENGEQIYKIGFIHESDRLLVLALPHNKFTDIEIQVIVQTIGRVIKFNYNSMTSAFEDESNHSNLTTIFSVLEHLLTEDIKYSAIDSIFLNAIKRLLIEDNLVICLNDSLSEYEAMDWLSEDSSQDIHQQNSSQLIVIGSCLLYKGFLLTSDLSNHQLKDIYSFLSLKGLLSLHKSHALRLVLWIQVFPTFETNSNCNDSESEDIKYFIAIVGFRHMIHCTLLEMPFIYTNETPIKANEVVINESIGLLKSHFTKSGLTDEIEHCFDVQQMAIKQFFDRKTERKRYKSFSSLRDLLSLSSSTNQLKQGMHRSTGSLSSLKNSSISGSMKSRSSPSLQHSLISRMSSSATSLSHTNSKDTASVLTRSNNNCIYLQQNFKLPENMICYLDIEDGQQVFAGPLLQWPKDICEQISKKFAECCYGISPQFTHSGDGENLSD